MTTYARLMAWLGLLWLQQLAALTYPKASLVQWFGGKYHGSRIDPNVIVWHTTETGTWPGYEGGATAPHFTILVDLKRRVLMVRQHFDTTESARALRNLAGGVETNTLNALQVELVGTCSRDYATKYGYLYWPEAPDWVLHELAAFMVWVHQQHDRYPLRDAAPRGWKAYPSSYDNGAGQRMTNAEWSKAVGNVGHQHVPENVHGDPGDLRMGRMVELAQALTGGEPVPPAPPAAVPPKPTPVSKARGKLRDAIKAAQDRGQQRRVAKIKAGLAALPKR